MSVSALQPARCSQPAITRICDKPRGQRHGHRTTLLAATALSGALFCLLPQTASAIPYATPTLVPAETDIWVEPDKSGEEMTGLLLDDPDLPSLDTLLLRSQGSTFITKLHKTGHGEWELVGGGMRTFEQILIDSGFLTIGTESGEGGTTADVTATSLVEMGGDPSPSPSPSPAPALGIGLGSTFTAQAGILGSGNDESISVLGTLNIGTVEETINSFLLGGYDDVGIAGTLNLINGSILNLGEDSDTVTLYAGMVLGGDGTINGGTGAGMVMSLEYMSSEHDVIVLDDAPGMGEPYSSSGIVDLSRLVNFEELLKTGYGTWTVTGGDAFDPEDESVGPLEIDYIGIASGTLNIGEEDGAAGHLSTYSKIFLFEDDYGIHADDPTLTINEGSSLYAGNGIESSRSQASSFSPQKDTINVFGMLAVEGMDANLFAGDDTFSIGSAGELYLGGPGGHDDINVRLGAGEDTLNLTTGMMITGTGQIIGGKVKDSFTDTVYLLGDDTGTFYLDRVRAFEKLIKEDDGTWTIEDSMAGSPPDPLDGNFFSAGTRVSGGTLNVNGTLISDVLVKTGATLGGTGTIFGNSETPWDYNVTIEEGATLAPGNSIGTLEVIGDVGFHEGSIFKPEVNAAGESDLLDVDGYVNLGGATLMVEANPEGTYMLETIYTIIKAGDKGEPEMIGDPVDGEFGDVTVNLSYLDAHYNIIDGEEEGREDVVLLLTRNTLEAEMMSESGNQGSVGGSLDDLVNGPMDDALKKLLEEFLGLPEAEALAVLDALSGEDLAALANARLAGNGQFMQLLRTRLAALGFSISGSAQGAQLPRLLAMANSGQSFDFDDILYAAANPANEAVGPSSNAQETTMGAWIRGFGNFGERDGDGANAGFDYTNYGVAVGADSKLGDHALVGVAFSFGETEADSDNPAINNDLEALTFEGGLYGRYILDAFYVDAAFSYGYTNYESRRDLMLGGPGVTVANADFDGYTLGSTVQTGYRLNAPGGLIVEPIAGASWTHVNTDGYTESGTAGPLALVVAEMDSDTVTSFLGFNLARPFVMNDGNGAIVPEVEAYWSHEYGDQDETVNQRFVASAPGTSTAITSAGRDRDSAVIGAGLTVRISEKLAVGVRYDGSFSGTDKTHGTSGVLRLDW